MASALALSLANHGHFGFNATLNRKYNPRSHLASGAAHFGGVVVAFLTTLQLEKSKLAIHPLEPPRSAVDSDTHFVCTVIVPITRRLGPDMDSAPHFERSSLWPGRDQIANTGTRMWSSFAHGTVFAVYTMLKGSNGLYRLQWGCAVLAIPIDLLRIVPSH